MNKEEIKNNEGRRENRRSIKKNNKSITRRDDKKADNETIFYYALTRNIDLKELHKNNNLLDENEKINLDELEPKISNKEFNVLIKLLNEKIEKTSITNFGETLDNIYEKLTQIVLYLYKDEKSILDNSLVKKVKAYSNSYSFIYAIIEEIIKNVSINQKRINITPEYIKRYMNFIYENYSNIIPIKALNESIVQMAMTYDEDEKSVSTDDNLKEQEDNLKIILDFYEYLLSNFNRKQVSLDELNQIGRNLKCLNIEELKTVIDCVKNLRYRKNDEKEAKVIISQIIELSRLYLDDMKQTKIKIINGKLNTAQLQKNLDKINKKTPKRRIREPKSIKHKKRTIVFTGTVTTILALLGVVYINNNVRNSNATSIKNSNTITMENEDDESIFLDTIIEEDNNEIKEYEYSLYYPVLYKKIDENGQLIERQAYVGVDSRKVQLEEKNTLFVAKENTDENGQVLYTVPKTNVDKINIIFPFTLAYVKDTVNLENGTIIDKDSSVYIINYTENEQLEGTFKVLYNLEDVSYTCEMSREDIANKLNISTDILRKININGENIPIYGYSIKAFKADNDIVLQSPILGVPGTVIPQNTVVTGFLYKGKQGEKILIFYKDPNTLNFYMDYVDSELLKSDIQKKEEDNDIQYIGEFVTTTNMPASNGQSIISCEDDEEFTLDLYLSARQMVVKSKDGTVNEVSSREIPYIQKALDSILLDNPKLKEYAETCLIDDEYGYGITEDKSESTVEDVSVVEPKQSEEIITPEVITPIEEPVPQEQNILVEQIEPQPEQVASQQEDILIDLGEDR